ncbi:MAG TPA: hypothetical protein VM802_08605, partial [Chitinophaga sp.]|uniref:hypothetical protein n=1 Tax=Chitinophaga sp. TaxID=1869181 RepID=UPI002CE1D794
MRNYLLIPLFLLILGAHQTQAQQTLDKNRVMEYLQEQQYDEAITYLRDAVNKNDPRQMAL